MPDPTLTDEELARLDEFHVRVDGFPRPSWCRDCRRNWPCSTSRLIAALRASRESENDLAEALEHVMKEVQEPWPNGLIYGPGDYPYEVLSAYRMVNRA